MSHPFSKRDPSLTLGITVLFRSPQSAAKSCAADPLNLRPQSARLEVRRNFFSNRTVEDWNKIPSEVKNARTVAIFKDGYAKHRVGLVGSTD
jgi:hypothetical protein